MYLSLSLTLALSGGHGVPAPPPAVNGSPPALQTPQARAPRPLKVFPKLVFSFNKGSGISSTQWQILTQHADLVFGLDGHGYEFPGYLDDFRAVNQDTPVFGFVTTMAIQRDGIADGRFKYLDHYEDAFLHCADPASLKAVVIGGVTRLFWVRDQRRDASTSYPSPIGVTSYVLESAAAKTGPWSQEGAPIAESGGAYYEATVGSADPARWYRLRTRLADSTQYTDYSWPEQPDPAAAGFAYLKVSTNLSFVAAMWGSGPANASDVVFEWGNQSGWGQANPATARNAPVNGITEYTGVVSNYPSSGAWVVRLRSASQGIASMKFDASRRNNRIVDRYGAQVFKPDHANALLMHKSRLASMLALGLTGARLDFALDSFPSWYVATLPLGEDAAYANIEPRVLALLTDLKASYPTAELILNGISVTASYTGIYDYLPPADGADCEYLGWSSPTATAPFRDSDMLDGAIGLAHVRGKTVTCYSYAAAADIDARVTSLARYWLVYAPNVYFQYMTADNHQSVDYFPEFDVDLGRPERALLASRADLLSGSVYRREFMNGSAYYNPGSAPVTVNFGGPRFLVRPQGTYSPKQGGTGSVQFLGPYTSTSLAAKRGAIVVKLPGLGR